MKRWFQIPVNALCHVYWNTHRHRTAANQEISRAVFEMKGADKPAHHLSALVQIVCNNFCEKNFLPIESKG